MAEPLFKPSHVHWEELQRLYADDPLLAELFARMGDWSANPYPEDYFTWAAASATASRYKSFGTGTITTATPLSIYTSHPSYFTTSTSGTSNTITVSEPPTVSWNDDGTYTLKYAYTET